ncbi:ATP/GTP-binding protein [Nonomuraea sp. NPDC050783]|uniref:AAA family ATPase n=1 Tax=Nonomuraea sp. NPDC050783 TaxID=3154634 RepID=UPI0034669DD3
MWLRFRVANHRSIQDEQTLSLVAVPRRGEPRGTAPLRVAGIYGANASGKSNVLDALHWMIDAIRSSHTTWSPNGGVPRAPFKLSASGSGSPSFFELDFLHEDVRYSYGFEVDDMQVTGEWLNSFPKGRAKRLFERDGPADMVFGRGLTGEVQRIRRLTRPNSLFLSCAASNNHPLLSSLYKHLTRRILFARLGEEDEGFRLNLTKYLLGEESMAPILNGLLRIADLGIDRAEVVEAPPEAPHATMSDLPPETLDDPTSKAALEIMMAKLILSRPGDLTPLSLEEESAGTRSWLSLLGYALFAFSVGGVLVSDEIDSSLHPLLSSTLIRMFKDPDINPRGAQLVFASHDTTLLGPLLEEEILARDEVWFTEKDASGATSLYSLAEFHPRRDENVERGYLQGRYGAVPYLNFENVRDIFLERIPERS